MKLIERLNQLPDDVYIYIGTKNGSAWLWIDQNKEMKVKLKELDASVKEVEERSLVKKELHIESIENQIIVANRKLDLAIAAEAERIANSETEDEESDNGEKKEDNSKGNEVINAEREIRILNKDLEQSQNYAKSLRTYLDNWIALENRELVTEHVPIIETGGIGLIVRGIESGKYWMLSEVKASKKM